MLHVKSFLFSGKNKLWLLHKANGDFKIQKVIMGSELRKNLSMRDCWKPPQPPGTARRCWWQKGREKESVWKNNSPTAWIARGHAGILRSCWIPHYCFVAAILTHEKVSLSLPPKYISNLSSPLCLYWDNPTCPPGLPAITTFLMGLKLWFPLTDLLPDVLAS